LNNFLSSCGQSATVRKYETLSLEVKLDFEDSGFKFPTNLIRIFTYFIIFL